MLSNSERRFLNWVLWKLRNFNDFKFQFFEFRSFPQLGCAQSLLPLHTAVSSARLISCLAVDSRSSRSLSQGMLCSANPGV